MTESTEAKLVRGAPYLPVGDLDRAMSHYQDVLGFQTEYVGGAPPEFAIMSRDKQPVMLRLVDTPESICPNERQGGTWDVFYWVQDLDELSRELKAAGAEVVYGPMVQAAYGMTEFAVRDPDGHVLGFGEPLE